MLEFDSRPPLSPALGSKKHTCEAFRAGDWIIHKCPKCAYELWDNLQTGEMKVFNTKVNINHSGFYVSPESYDLSKNIN